MDGDAPAYFSPAVELARGGGFENSVWLPPLNDSIDGPGGRRFIYHGFLYPLFIGLAANLTGGDVPACFGWAYAVATLAALVSAAGILIGYRQVVPSMPPFLLIGTGFLSVAGVFGLAVAWFGRVEAMALFWVGSAVCGWRIMSWRWASIVCGFCAGALLLTSPACGVIAMPLLLAAMLLRSSAPLLPSVFLSLIGACLAVVLGLAVYPFTFADWVGGVFRHGRIFGSLAPFQGFVSTWVMKVHLPLLVVSFGLVLLSAIPPVWKRVRAVEVWRRYAVAGALLISAALLFRIAIVKSEAAYNAVVWIPLIAAVAATWPRIVPMQLALLVALFLPTAGVFRFGAVLLSQPHEEATYAGLREELERLRGRDVLVSPGLFLAVPELREVRFGRNPAVLQSSPPEWFFDQQYATGRKSPAAYEGYELLEDHFGPGVTVMGFPLSRTPGGWQYALYRRIPVSPASD
jgi:hypothetical protein